VAIMPHIVVIEPCYNELEKIKAQMIEEKKARGEPTKTTFSEVVCMLIRERKNSNDLAEKPIMVEDETSLILDGGDSKISPIPAQDTIEVVP
jgi:hypothetical protein